MLNIWELKSLWKPKSYQGLLLFRELVGVQAPVENKATMQYRFTQQGRKQKVHNTFMVA